MLYKKEYLVEYLLLSWYRYNKRIDIDLMFKLVDTPFPTAPNVVVLNPTRYNTLCEPQAAVRSLDALCFRYMYVCKTSTTHYVCS